MKKEKICGIYRIICTSTKKFYIGQAIDIEKRWKDHVYELDKDIHFNEYLQRSWSKYGKENFEFEILENCLQNELNDLEIFYIEKFDSVAPNGFNFTYGGKSGARSEISKIKLSDAIAGRKEKKSSSIYYGVTFDKFTGKWMVGFTNRRKRIYLGRFENEIGAAIAYDEYVEQSEYNGIHPLNFKEKDIREAIKNILNEEKIKYHKEHKERKKHKGIIPNKETKKRKNSSSKYLGVFFDKSKNKWGAALCYKKEKISIGCFVDEIDAAKAYDKYVIENNIDRELNFKF
jgi:group I intron endonuclease